MSKAPKALLLFLIIILLFAMYFPIHTDKEYYMKYSQGLLKALGIKPGDIILFSGEGITSNLIKIITVSKYSHVGMVVDCGAGINKELCLFEASGPFSFINKTIGKTRIIPLDEALNKYKGEAWFRSLRFSLSQYKTELLNSLVLRYLGKPYEENMLELLKSAIDLPDWMLRIPLLGNLLKKISINKENRSSLFCSELVSFIFEELNVSELPVSNNELTPKDLSSSSKYFPFSGDKVFSLEESLQY